MRLRQFLRVLRVVTSCWIMFLGSAALAQQIEIGPGSAAGSGWTPWYEVRIDPEDSSKLVLCGSKWDAGDNASYGFVYFSSDGGTDRKSTRLNSSHIPLSR